MLLWLLLVVFVQPLPEFILLLRICHCTLELLQEKSQVFLIPRSNIIIHQEAVSHAYFKNQIIHLLLLVKILNQQFFGFITLLLGVRFPA